MRRYEEHTILPYYNSSLAKEAYVGIETIIWRSSLIAFADCSGISLYDIQSFKPIARVDRPGGAQPSLYHFMDPFTNITRNENVSINDVNQIANSTSVAHIKPHLHFETSRSLLVAWGDCLMTLSISDMTATVAEQQATRSTEAALGTTSTPTAAAIRKRRPRSSLR